MGCTITSASFRELNVVLKSKKNQKGTKGKKDGNVYVQVRSPPAATPGSHEIPSLASNRSSWRTHADGRCSRCVLFAERGRV